MNYSLLGNDSNETCSPDSDILKKANEGDSTAQFELGESYFYASYSEKNHLNTFKWISRSAEQGNIHAQFRLGDLYALGKGTCQSYTNAYKWYTKAAIRGYKKALIRIHNLYQEDIRMHCRGKLILEEELRKKGYNSGWELVYYYRELNEQRLDNHKIVLNHAIDYYTAQFEKYQLSNQDDPDIQLNIAFLYQHGYNVKKYTSVAMKYYTLAAEQGLVDAQYNLGRLYQQNTNIKFNYRKAFYWYSLSAKGGNIAAQNCLAYFYEKGLSTDINYEQALYWYTKAANAGNSEAQLTLGKWYRKGQCVNQDHVQAAQWYKLAAKQENQVAQNCLDLLYQTGKMDTAAASKETLKYSTEGSRRLRLCSRLRFDIDKLNHSVKTNQLKKMAMNAFKSDGNAMYEIGKMYLSGENFVKDEGTGFRWILNAANTGSKDAQFKIAEMYENGEAVEQNYHKTSIWIKRIAQKKDNIGQYKLGVLYKEGLGVRQDSLESSKWIILSANQGNSDAMFELGELKSGYNRYTSYKKDIKEAVKWYFESAIQRNLNACYRLGRVYLNDNGVKQDVNKAIRILNYAARHGHSESQYELGEIYEKGGMIPQDLLKSNEYYTMITGVLSCYSAYDLAKKYVNGKPTSQDNIKAFYLFKKAAEDGCADSMDLFQLPMGYLSEKLNCYDLINMFKDASESGIAKMEFNIGCAYEYGIYSSLMEELFAINYNNAIHWYSISARKGDSRADYRLGLMHEKGKGLTKDMLTAIKYYTKAASSNNNDAIFRLAHLYLVGYALPQDITKAYYLFTEASNSGHLRSRKALMLLDNTEKTYSSEEDLELEELIDFDEEHQINMLESMAERGLVAVQYQLGKMYQDKDGSKGIKWLTLAAKGGIFDACYRLGVFYEEGKDIHQSYSAAIKLYEKAAEGDHEDAIYHLAQMYQFGRGIRIHYMEAYYLYLRASEMGHNRSFKVLNIIGDPYRNSEGVITKNEFDISSEDFKQSLQMCEYVAQLGDIDLQFKIGTVYECRMQEPDYSKAFKWYEMASFSYHKEAIYRLGLLYEKGLGVDQNYHKSLQLFEQAKDLKSSDAIYRLGVAYHYGHGIEVDQDKAVEYYTLAAEMYNPLSQYTLGNLYETGDLVGKNILKSLKWYTRAYLQGYDTAGSNLIHMYDDTPYENFFYKRFLNILQQISAKTPEEVPDDLYYNACNRLGLWYYREKKSDKNFKKAWEYLLKPFSNRSYDITFTFLYCNFINTQEKNDILNQLKLDNQLLNSLRGIVLFRLGMIYYKGIVDESNHCKLKQNEESATFVGNEKNNDTQNTIIKQDYSDALFFLRKATEKDCELAQHQLGVMYHYGFGIDTNIQEAEKWYIKTVNNDNRISLLTLGNLYYCDGELQDFSKALKLFKSNDWNSIHVGLFYHYGTGVEQSYKKALEHYHSSNSYLWNQKYLFFYLGLIYYDSCSSYHNYKKAFRLFREITKIKPDYEFKFILVRPTIVLNTNETTNKYTYTLEPLSVFYGETYYYLGIMYRNGQGTPRDDLKATHCFLKAVEYGNEQAKQYIE